MLAFPLVYVQQKKQKNPHIYVLVIYFSVFPTPTVMVTTGIVLYVTEYLLKLFNYNYTKLTIIFFTNPTEGLTLYFGANCIFYKNILKYKVKYE